MLFIERIVCQEKEIFLWLKSYSISLFGDLWIWSQPEVYSVEKQSWGLMIVLCNLNRLHASLGTNLALRQLFLLVFLEKLE